jgi:predicted AlkP superfamily pyrophosphatase or phosphodiesterase
MRYTFLVISLLSIQLHAQPKLVVGIVVDQMKQEYLIRFADKYGNDGFKRMIDQGFQVKNMHYNYIPTYTAPGHASIYTGTTPSFHGIISNDWYSRAKKGNMYCVEDASVDPLGTDSKAGRMSPQNLYANTITDELKLTTNFRSKVVGVSIKDRGAVLPAGHKPEAALWYDATSGNFISSTWYYDKLPDWVDNFNNKKIADTYSNQTWNTFLPIEKYVESTADDSPYEGGFKGKDSPTFPYNLKKLRKENGEFGLIRYTPFGNQLVLDIAKEALISVSMGKDDITDFLAVSLSSTDYIGHNFGPNSVELEDTYIRLDRQLADFLKFLDEKLGKEAYMVFLTADHGVVANPRFLNDNNMPGGYINSKEHLSTFKDAVKEKFNTTDMIENVSNDQIFIDYDVLKSLKLDRALTERELLNIMIQSDPIIEGLTGSDLSRFDYHTPLRAALQNGFNKERSGDVLYLKKPGYLYQDYGTTGTSHGTGYTYDTHVPLLFLGNGIKQGSTVRKYNITDIAPTLSFLMNISIPNASVAGAPIMELFED